MDIEAILAYLNKHQRIIIICLTIQFPLCYTFMSLYSDYFLQQEFMDKVIFSISFDISIVMSSITLSSIDNTLRHKNIGDLMYVYTSVACFSLIMTSFRKIVNKDIDMFIVAFLYYFGWLIIIVIFSLIINIVLPYIKPKCSKKNKT